MSVVLYVVPGYAKPYTLFLAFCTTNKQTSTAAKSVRTVLHSIPPSKKHDNYSIPVHAQSEEKIPPQV